MAWRKVANSVQDLEQPLTVGVAPAEPVVSPPSASLAGAEAQSGADGFSPILLQSIMRDPATLINAASAPDHLRPAYVNRLRTMEQRAERLSTATGNRLALLPDQFLIVSSKATAAKESYMVTGDVGQFRSYVVDLCNEFDAQLRALETRHFRVETLARSVSVEPPQQRPTYQRAHSEGDVVFVGMTVAPAAKQRFSTTPVNTAPPKPKQGTLAEVERWLSETPEIEEVNYDRPRGRGYALRCVRDCRATCKLLAKQDKMKLEQLVPYHNKIHNDELFAIALQEMGDKELEDMILPGDAFILDIERTCRATDSDFERELYGRKALRWTTELNSAAFAGMVFRTPVMYLNTHRKLEDFSRLFFYSDFDLNKDGSPVARAELACRNSLRDGVAHTQLKNMGELKMADLWVKVQEAFFALADGDINVNSPRNAPVVIGLIVDFNRVADAVRRKVDEHAKRYEETRSGADLVRIYQHDVVAFDYAKKVHVLNEYCALVDEITWTLNTFWVATELSAGINKELGDVVGEEMHMYQNSRWYEVLLRDKGDFKAYLEEVSEEAERGSHYAAYVARINTLGRRMMVNGQLEEKLLNRYLQESETRAALLQDVLEAEHCKILDAAPTDANTAAAKSLRTTLQDLRTKDDAKPLIKNRRRFFKEVQQLYETLDEDFRRTVRQTQNRIHDLFNVLCVVRKDLAIIRKCITIFTHSRPREMASFDYSQDMVSEQFRIRQSRIDAYDEQVVEELQKSNRLLKEELNRAQFALTPEARTKKIKFNTTVDYRSIENAYPQAQYIAPTQAEVVPQGTAEAVDYFKRQVCVMLNNSTLAQQFMQQINTYAGVDVPLAHKEMVQSVFQNRNIHLLPSATQILTSVLSNSLPFALPGQDVKTLLEQVANALLDRQAVAQSNVNANDLSFKVQALENTLQNERASFMEQLNQAQQKAAAAEAACAHYQTEANKYANEYARVSQYAADLQPKLSDADKSTFPKIDEAQWKAAESKYQDAIAQNHSLSQTLQRVAREKDQEIALLRSYKEAADNRVATITQEYNGLFKTVGSSRTAISEAEAKYQAAVKERNDTTSKMVATLSGVYDQIKRQNDALHATANERGQQYEALKTEFDSLAQADASTKEQVAKLVQINNLLNTENAQLKSALHNLQQSTSAIQNANNPLQLHLNKANDDLQNMHLELVNLKTICRNQTDASQKMKQELAQLMEERKTWQESATQKLQAARDEVARLQMQVSSHGGVSQELQTTQNLLAEARNTLQKYSAEIKQTKDKYNMSLENRTVLENQLTAARERLSSYENQADIYKTQTTQQLESHKTEAARLAQELKAAQEQNTSLLNTITDLNRRQDALASCANVTKNIQVNIIRGGQPGPSAVNAFVDTAQALADTNFGASTFGLEGTSRPAIAMPAIAMPAAPRGESMDTQNTYSNVRTGLRVMSNGLQHFEQCLPPSLYGVPTAGLTASDAKMRLSNISQFVFNSQIAALDVAGLLNNDITEQTAPAIYLGLAAALYKQEEILMALSNRINRMPFYITGDMEYPRYGFSSHTQERRIVEVFNVISSDAAIETAIGEMRETYLLQSSGMDKLRAALRSAEELLQPQQQPLAESNDYIMVESDDFDPAQWDTTEQWNAGISKEVKQEMISSCQNQTYAADPLSSGVPGPMLAASVAESLRLAAPRSSPGRAAVLQSIAELAQPGEARTPSAWNAELQQAVSLAPQGQIAAPGVEPRPPTALQYGAPRTPSAFPVWNAELQQAVSLAPQGQVSTLPALMAPGVEPRPQTAQAVAPRTPSVFATWGNDLQNAVSLAQTAKPGELQTPAFGADGMPVRLPSRGGLVMPATPRPESNYAAEAPPTPRPGSVNVALGQPPPSDFLSDGEEQYEGGLFSQELSEYDDAANTQEATYPGRPFPKTFAEVLADTERSRSPYSESAYGTRYDDPNAMQQGARVPGLEINGMLLQGNLSSATPAPTQHPGTALAFATPSTREMFAELQRIATPTPFAQDSRPRSEYAAMAPSPFAAAAPQSLPAPGRGILRQSPAAMPPAAYPTAMPSTQAFAAELQRIATPAPPGATLDVPERPESLYAAMAPSPYAPVEPGASAAWQGGYPLRTQSLNAPWQAAQSVPGRATAPAAALSPARPESAYATMAPEPTPARSVPPGVESLGYAPMQGFNLEQTSDRWTTPRHAIEFASDTSSLNFSEAVDDPYTVPVTAPVSHIVKREYHTVATQPWTFKLIKTRKAHFTDPPRVAISSVVSRKAMAQLFAQQDGPFPHQPAYNGGVWNFETHYNNEDYRTALRKGAHGLELSRPTVAAVVNVFLKFRRFSLEKDVRIKVVGDRLYDILNQFAIFQSVALPSGALDYTYVVAQSDTPCMIDNRVPVTVGIWDDEIEAPQEAYGVVFNTTPYAPGQRHLTVQVRHSFVNEDMALMLVVGVMVALVDGTEIEQRLS